MSVVSLPGSSKRPLWTSLTLTPVNLMTHNHGMDTFALVRAVCIQWGQDVAILITFFCGLQTRVQTRWHRRTSTGSDLSWSCPSYLWTLWQPPSSFVSVYYPGFHEESVIDMHRSHCTNTQECTQTYYTDCYHQYHTWQSEPWHPPISSTPLCPRKESIRAPPSPSNESDSWKAITIHVTSDATFFTLPPNGFLSVRIQTHTDWNLTTDLAYNCSVKIFLS